MAVVNVFLTAPDLITQIIMMVFSFVAILGVLCICLRLIPVASWSLGKQRAFIWPVAIVAGVCVHFIPLALGLSSR